MAEAIAQSEGIDASNTLLYDSLTQFRKTFSSTGDSWVGVENALAFEPHGMLTGRLTGRLTAASTDNERETRH